MSALQLTLTAEEAQVLLDLLERTLKDLRIEEHRTRTPIYREDVKRRENVLLELANKLRLQPA